MADTALQERLRDHAKAFDGLLSLIPAKMYYGEDTSDQWRKKKQTKDQARAAKRGKLDPDSELNRNAKEVLDERARNKRKLRELESESDSESGSEQGDDDSDISGIEKEKPGEGLKRKKPKLDEEEEDDKSVKKTNGKVTDEKTIDEPEQQTGEPTPSKRQKAKEEKKLAKKQKQAEAKKMKEEEANKAKGENSKKGAKPEKAEKTKKAETKPAEETKHSVEKPTGDQNGEPAHDSAEASSDDGDMEPIDVSGLGNGNEDTSADSAPHSPVFDTTKNTSAEPASTTTSISSAVPPSEKPKYLKIPADTTALRARLEAKLTALRAARKAADSEGKPIRTRQDLIEARRQKQAQRKAHKQEMRRLAKEEEEKKREQALNSARNSPGLSPLFEQDDDRNANHFAFGRLTFSDGTQLSHDLSYEKSPSGKKKGPSDPKTALLKLEAQKKRLANMDENKRKEVLEKETWLAARKRAEGEKVRDNESLLKKALKRKEKQKKKSEREWKERTESVKAAMQERQRKREENIRKRREEKLARKAGKKNKGVQTRKKNRPGFEGGFGGGKK